MAFLGMIMALDLITYQFVKIPIPLFSIRFDHVWPIVVPMIYGFGLGLFFNLLADTLNQLIAGQIGFYMWQYTLSMVFITIIVSVMRMAFYVKEKPSFNRWGLIFNNCFVLAMGGVLTAVLVVYNNGINVSNDPLTETIRTYTPAFFWVGIGLTVASVVAALVALNWKYHKTKGRTNAISAVYVLSMVFAVVIVVDVVWEAYAYQQYLAIYLKSRVATYPYFYFVATRIPEKILIGVISYIVIEALYNVSRFLIKDKSERITY